MSAFPGLALDLIDGATGSHHILQGWSVSGVALVTNLVLTPPVTTGALFEAALAVIIGAIGDRGSPCPGISVPTYLEQFIPESVTTEEVKVRIIWKGYPTPIIEFSSASNQVESNLDADGNLITVQYKYPDKYLLDPRKAGKTVTQGGMISRPLPQVTYTRKFTIVATDGDLSKTLSDVTDLLLLEGKTNLNVYSVGSLPGAPRTWLVTSVRAQTRDGVSYEMGVSMEYREETWDPLVVFINPDDGKPPPDIIKGTGSKVPKGPKAVNFPSFNLGFDN